ncbi:FAD dependent oxidoreductase [Cylindrobasidium torrendii FP15055 ss-10]|uniref:FAD dependent oxidoreductase n=1 Tax=Cylindrobasidium torrendii FP15055 ss-10 TaxID=1314674 RepID=A0A0D7BD19_9AGAR|nr:FAD dependent oxidoreductase [Cylindrobasidium torrendii FP15055 ss-10]
MSKPTDPIVIIGAGVFGISTAYHLLKRGYTDVTVLERAPELPPADGSSNDFNRIIRTSYDDSFYASLAKDAVALWKDQHIFPDSYHESGVLVISPSSQAAYIDAAYETDKSLGLRLEKLPTGSDVHTNLSSTLQGKAFASSFTDVQGYLNKDGGWAHAANGVAGLTEQVRKLGGKVLPGKTVRHLLKEQGKTSGVECDDGSKYHAVYTVICTGAWTGSLFPELHSSGVFEATGQCVAMVELTAEEAAAYKDMPVVLNFGNGFYCFPPSKENLVKMAIHSRGYTYKKDNVSTPRTVVSDGQDGLRIPKSDVKALRTAFAEVFPELAKKPFIRTRLCWYTDTVDGNWVIGVHPTDAGLILGTAGNGHAYKFLPVIGRIVADAVQGIMDPATKQRFALDRKTSLAKDGSREYQKEGRRELIIEELCTPEDLLYPDAVPVASN